MKHLDPKPGEIWLTRDGTKARIYAVDGGGNHPVHGAAHMDGRWQMSSWREDGFRWGGEDSESPYDLIQKYDWREELAPIWAVLKPEYTAMAMNARREWFACTTKDSEIENGGWVLLSYVEYVSLTGLTLPTPNCDWTETWTMRPDVTMCLSTTCPAKNDCRRNPECQEALPIAATAQSYAYWYPDAGYSCPGFWEARELQNG